MSSYLLQSSRKRESGRIEQTFLSDQQSSRCGDVVLLTSEMLFIAVSVRRLKTVLVSIFLLLIIIVFLNSESNDEINIPSVKDPSIQPSKQSLKETTTEEYDYEEIPIPLWGEFLPTDVRFEKDIFFLETKGYKASLII